MMKFRLLDANRPSIKPRTVLVHTAGELAHAKIRYAADRSISELAVCAVAK